MGRGLRMDCSPSVPPLASTTGLYQHHKPRVVIVGFGSDPRVELAVSPKRTSASKVSLSSMSVWLSSVLSSARSSWWTVLVDVFVYLLVAVACILCYANSLNGDFVHDDLVAVTSNPDVIGKNPVLDMFLNDFWGKAMADPCSHKSYRPLTVLTFRLNHFLSGLSSWGYHVVNVSLHTIVTLLFTCFCLEVLRWPREDSATAALLFAAHPIHTEAVSSIVGRAEVLSAVFFFASFLSFTKCSAKDGGEEKKHYWLSLSLSFAACSLLAKEQGIAVLPLCFIFKSLLMWDKKKKAKSSKNGIYFITDVTLWSAVLMSVILVAFRVWMLQGSLPKFSEQDNPASFSPSLLTRFLTYSYLAAFNAWMLLCPSNLSYDWQMGSVPLVTSALDPRNLTWILLYAFLATAILSLFIAFSSPSSKNSERRTLVLSLCIIALPFLPAANLFVTVGFVVAERVLYIPSAGFCILITYGLRKLRNDLRHFSWIFRFIAFALVIIFMCRTIRRNQDWSSREALFRSGLASVPHNAKVHYNFANLQKDLGNVDSAVEHYRTALSLWPNHASAHNNLGTLLSNLEDAEHHFKSALVINPEHTKALFNLASLYSRQGRTQVAQELLQRALELDEEFLEAYSSLANIHAEGGRQEQAELLHRKALAVDPENADTYNNYGTFLQKSGRVEEAVLQYKQAIRLQPNHTVAIINAARSLRTLKNNREAEELYKRALTIHPEARIMDNLGVLYISAGRIGEAKKVYDDMQQKYADYMEGKVHLAQVLMQERSFQQAEQLLLAVVQENSTHMNALHQLSILYSQVNRTTEALEQILKALNLCSPGDIACAQLHADHGDILKDMKYWEDASQSYRMAIELDPKLSHAHVNLAVINHLQGECHQALRHYHEAYILDPDNQLLQENMRKLKLHLLDGSGTCQGSHPATCQSR